MNHTEEEIIQGVLSIIKLEQFRDMLTGKDERVSDSFLSWSLCHSGWLTLGHMFVVSPLSLSLHCLLTAWAELIIGLPPLPSIARITYHIFTSVFQ